MNKYQILTMELEQATISDLIECLAYACMIEQRTRPIRLKGESISEDMIQVDKDHRELKARIDELKARINLIMIAGGL